jgi:TRAP-type C4-dicarboxylate transport system substrate-binding protein
MKLVVALTLALTTLGYSADPGVVEIKLATILPADTSGHQRLMEMRDAWRKIAGPTVKLTIFPGSGDGEIQLIKKVRADRLQAALVSAVGLAQIDRSATCLQLIPLQFRSWAEVDYVRDKICGELESRLRTAGFEVLFWADAGWVRFFSKEAAVRPVDLKPMKMFVWTGDPEQLTILRGLGYHPLGLETEQILPALSTGMINVVPVPPFLANALQYNRYAGHMIDLPWVPIVGAAIVRREVWERIPSDTREALLKASAPIGHKLRQKARDEDEAAVTAMRKRGLVVHTPTAENVTEWRALAEEVYPKIRGKLVPADLFDRVQSYVAEFRAANGSGAP